MSCTIKLPNEKLDNALFETLGKNDTLRVQIITTVLDENNTQQYSQGFQNYLEHRNNLKVEDINDSNFDKVIKTMRDYNNLKHPDTNYSAQRKNKNSGISRFGYTTIDAREEAKRLAATYALNTYQLITKENGLSIDQHLKNLKKEKNIEYTKNSFFADNITAQVKAEIRDRLLKRGFNEEQVTQLIRSNDITAIEKLFGDNMVLQDRNMLAMYREILMNRERFFNDVFNNKRISELRIDSFEVAEEDNNYEATEEQNAEDGDNAAVEQDTNSTDDKDYYISELTEKMEFKNFMQTVDMELKSYLGSLKKLNSGLHVNRNPIDINKEKAAKEKKGDTSPVRDWDYDYDTDNNLGVPETISTEFVAAILYTSADFNSCEILINSIRNIANNTPGCAALHQLADDMETNSDLAWKVFSTFGRFNISKVETNVDGSSATTKISNPTSDKLTTLKYEFLNNAKITTTLTVGEDIENEVEKINKLYSSLSSTQDTLNKLLSRPNPNKNHKDTLESSRNSEIIQVAVELAKQLKNYYPTIEDAAISNYIKQHNNGDYLKNIDTLKDILERTIKYGKESMAKFDTRQAKIGRQYARLAQLQRMQTRKINEIYAQRHGIILDGGMTLDGSRREEKLMPENEEIKDDLKAIKQAIKDTNNAINELYATSYVDEGTEGAAYSLATELVKYSNPKIDLNTRNVHGNQSSSIINDNLITNIMNTLKSTIALKNYGEYKSKSRQYDFSNIMIEHKDKTGKVINFGLFRKEENSTDFVPTEYAHRLLQARLFNGATDVINNSNVLYSEMSKGDYVATSFINYFNVDNITAKNEYGIKFANYFMRIPSDAPKNFIITAPKYNIGESQSGLNDGLFQIENLEAAQNEAKRMVKELPKLNYQDIKDKYMLLSPIERTLAQAASDATSRKIGDIKVNISSLAENNPKEGDTVSALFDYELKDKNSKYTQRNRYVLQGTLVKKDNGSFYMKNPEFVGYVDENHSKDLQAKLEEHFMKILDKEGFIEKSINTSHPIFQQFRNIFIQELTDAATAIDKFFVNTNGHVDLDENSLPKFKAGWSNNEKDVRKAYDVYHVRKGKFFTVKDGRAVLTGKVFTSDRFTITHIDENGKANPRNYGQELLDEAFSFLYGGVNNTFIKTKREGKNFKIELNDKQNADIDKKLIEFIKDYVNNVNNRIEQYKPFIPEHLLTQDNIAEFAINHRLMYANFNDIFEGDSKFYKDTQTELKRAKESQGSGVPYGIVNYDIKLDAPIVKIASSLDKAGFKSISETGETTDFNVELRTGFKAVTVKNTIRIGEAIGEFEHDSNGDIVEDENGIPKMTKVGNLTKKLISLVGEKKAKKMMTGYDRTKVNDAQSYITFEEWIRRVTARGQFKRYEPLIRAILDRTKDLDANTIGQFVQVQKNFYYDQFYNEQLGVIVPRQIKNAEFVLVPRLIEGTELEEVYNLMKKKEIDQLNTEETSKAGKANVLTLWDNNGKLTQKNIDDFRENANKISIENFNYNYLYTQQETPQHMDSENKAGIQIMKKIVDNIPPDHKLYNVKQKFFSLYFANIKESREDLLDSLGIERDENGRIKVDEDDNIVGLNAEKLFGMLKDEMVRLGMDSNDMDYVTLIDDPVINTENPNLIGITKMPTYFGNRSVKFENIIQSLFNNRITRQKLPGFHAAQVTNVGFNTFNIKKEGISYSKNLKFHPKVDGKVQPYAEIMLPASNFGLKVFDENGKRKSDDVLLKELQEAGLDEIIGYRIPTEGKQSVCIMKVVGFIDDAYGSTIVVPDDWVSQTGADFDIDSVYGIQFKTKIDPITGKIKKIAYETTPTIEGYYAYIRHKLEHRLPNADVDAIKKLVPQELEKEYEELFEKEGVLYKALPTKVREIIKDLQKVEKTGNKRDDYAKQNEAVINGLKDLLNKAKMSDKVKNQINEYIANREALNDYVVNFDQKYTERFGEKKDESKFKEVEKKAKKAGLPTFEEYSQLDETERNGRDARNNEILQSMLTILSDDSSLEENVSQSQFRPIIESRDASIDANVKTIRENRSPYDFFDQADYQEDVMSGAKLKAFSVVRDTFCSVCNTVRPYIDSHNAVKIIYKESDGYTEDNLKKSFSNIEELPDKSGWIVTHNTFGWTKNNLNVDGSILTAYSSYTTAHILDAVKEGAVPNVNDFTFQVYKLFPDIGSNYQTGVSFIMQPGVSRIVEAYNRNKSIYNNEHINPIHTAIREIAKELTTIDEKDTIIQILGKLQSYNKSIAELFDITDKEFYISFEPFKLNQIPFSAQKYKDRLKKEGIFKDSSPVGKENQLIFDLGVILQYYQLSNFATEISAFTRVTNPDKFGAKQSIFATEDVFRSIAEKGQSTVLYTKDGNITTPFLQSIYPGATDGNIETFLNSEDNNSTYPPLYAFLKYATATSIKVNRTMFETLKNPLFVDELLSLSDVFSGSNRRMTEKLYKDYQSYVLNFFYGQTEVVANPITYSEEEGIVYNGDGNKEEERARIFGYGKAPDLRVPVLDSDMNPTGDKIKFKVKDINYPTETEVNQFATFSPAQKVFWIQRNFDKKGIFGYLNTSLFNDKKYRRNKIGSHVLEYVESNDSIETIYDQFENAYYNDNPLIRLAAIDLIKYAFAVEGYKMKRNAVNKVIKNNALIEGQDTGGTAIINQLNGQIGKITRGNFATLKHEFVRSHSYMKQISAIRVKSTGRNQYELSTMQDGIIHLNLYTKQLNKETNEEETVPSYQYQLGKKYGMFYESNNGQSLVFNRYVKLKYGKDITLYRIENNGTEIIAYPLNLLEENEHGTFSVNEKNNLYLGEPYFRTIINNYFNSFITNNPITFKQSIEANRELRAKSRYISRLSLDSEKYATSFDINEKGTIDTPGFERVIDAVREHFTTLDATPLYFRDRTLGKYIKYTGKENSSIQTIDGQDYKIEKHDVTEYNNIYIGKENIDHKIKETNPQIVKIIEDARTHGQYGAKIDDVYKITPVKSLDDGLMFASVDEAALASSDAIDYMERRVYSEKDMDAKSNVDYIKDIQQRVASPSLEANQTLITNVIASYVTSKVDDIIGNIERFHEIGREGYSITDSETIELIKNDPIERQRFLKTILDARAFVKNFELYTHIDIGSKDTELDKNIGDIQDAIKRLRDNTTIAKAEELFGNEVLAKLSNNPLIQQDILSVFDGFHSASAFDAWFNDLQETSSPLLQIVTKEVMGDIRAAEMEAKVAVAAFRKDVKRIMDKAKANSRTVDWKHIIDEYGRFIQRYKPEFATKLQELNDAKSDAHVRFGKNSEQYLRAKLEYDKFKLNYIHQKIDDSYYERKLAIEERILDNFPKVYSKYKQLQERQFEILNASRDGALEGSLQDEYKKVKSQIDDLVLDYYFEPATNSFESKKSVSDPTNPLTGERRETYSLEATHSLKEYLSDMVNLKEEYFKEEDKSGFEKELEKNLDIMRDYEHPNAEGIPTRPMSLLMQSEEYVKAKTWVERNARFVIDKDLQRIINNAYVTLGEGGLRKKGRGYLKNLAKRKELYDSHGVIDATQLTEDEINKVKEEQLINYNLREEEPVSDKVLISNAYTSDTIFKRAFYDGMRVQGIASTRYLELVRNINDILRPYYDSANKILETHKITIPNLQTLIKYYDEIEGIKKNESTLNGRTVRRYIKHNVDFITNDAIYEEQKRLVEATQDARHIELWKKLNERVVDDNGVDKVVPNRMIYGYAVPRGYTPDGRGNNTMVDTAKTDAIRTIKKYMRTVPTEYYYQKFKEMFAKPKPEFDAWYTANHIYNPNTHTVEPIACWTKVEPKPVLDDGTYLPASMWVANWNQKESKPREEFLNENYQEGSNLSNYKEDNSHISSHFKDYTDYNNNSPMNEEEKEMKKLLENIVEKNATTTGSKRFFDRGFAPARMKGKEVDAKFIAKEAAKLVGWIEGSNGKEAWYDDIDYASDKTPAMPFMQLLKTKESLPIPRAMPIKELNEDDQVFAQRLQEWRKAKKEAEDANLQIHKDMLDNNWEDVFSDFIMKAAHFNAVQENKYMLFYAKNMLDKIDNYVQNIGFSDLEKDNLRSTEEETRYVTKKDTRLQEQYANWLRRLMYDQWKKRNNKFTRAGNILQSLSSAKFMMLNITGGIANVTVGEVNILAEVLAKDHFGANHYRAGKAFWSSGIPSYFRDMYSEEATSLPSAIIKFFNVVDFDELNGVVSVPDMQEYLKRARDAAFSPQATTEHFMQNGALFSLLYSNRVVLNPSVEVGSTKYTYMTEAEYIRMKEQQEFSNMLTDEQAIAFEDFKKRALKDANDKKEFAWFRRDLVTEFMKGPLSTNYAVQKEFIAKRKEIQSKAKEEFNNDDNFPTLMSQLELQDGMLGIKADSKLAELGKDAFKVLGRFKGRVISVNKKIHGVYDKLGAAQIESQWWGGIVMQYHKHLYPGIMKRYRRHGYYNEERGSIEKGAYQSLVDFLAIPFHQKEYAKKLAAETGATPAELQAAEGIQNLFKNYIEFFHHINVNWNIIPEYERANIRRAFGDMIGVLSALCTAVAMRCIYDDDDEGLVYNLFMYEADRLASESAMFNPWGLYSEGKKLWSSPTAAQSFPTDILTTMGLIGQWMIQGDEFDPYYSSGLYVGENKFEVLLKRNIPVWHSVNMLERLTRTNKYYKLTDNMLSVIPVKDIADFITGRN